MKKFDVFSSHTVFFKIDEKLMKIVAHTIRALLESDSSLVVGKVDCCNAFNAIHKHPILQVIDDEAPALLPFTNCLLNKAPAGTIYHDSLEQVTVVH